jgi:hypothetical protein
MYLVAAPLESDIDVGNRDDRPRTNDDPRVYYGAAYVGLDVEAARPKRPRILSIAEFQPA